MMGVYKVLLPRLVYTITLNESIPRVIIAKDYHSILSSKDMALLPGDRNNKQDVIVYVLHFYFYFYVKTFLVGLDQQIRKQLKTNTNSKVYIRYRK